MKAREELSSLVATLGESLELPGLALDELGVCALEIDGGLQVKLEYTGADGGLLLSTLIVEYEEARELGILRQICDANFMMIGTAGATLGAEPASRTVWFMSAHPIAGMTTPDLAARLEGFISLAIFWRGQLSAKPRGQTDEAFHPAWTRV